MAVPTGDRAVRLRPLSGRRRQRLAAVSRALEKRARATPSRCSSPCRTRSSSRTASRSRSRSALTSNTVWRPAQGVARLGAQHPVVAPLRDGRYEFELPPQIDPGWLDITIGDATSRVRIEPTLRPELTSVVASVTLPEYLGRPEDERKDVRGGAVSLVLGSVATFTATASRELRSAQVDGQSLEPRGATVTSPPAKIDGSRKIEFRWQDQFGLAGKEPFVLSITGREDEAPSLACEDLPRQKVVLDTELLSFKVRAQDDFGIKQIGIDWQGVDSPLVKHARPRASASWPAGGHDKESLEISGTFSAKSLGIEPQPVQVRLFAEDYLPGPRAGVFADLHCSMS